MNTTDEQPDLILEFPKGDYHHALRCYRRAQQWVLETGQAYRPDLYGRILSPEHPQSPQKEKLVPLDLVDEPNWTVRAELFASTEGVLNWLLALPLPESATLTRSDKQGDF